MVATIQKELAERVIAKPGSKDYSALSVWMQSQCQCEILRILPPTVFWPRPKVHSAILRIRPQKVLRQRISDLTFFHSLVRNIFLHRRKYLRSALFYAAQQAVSQPPQQGGSRDGSGLERQTIDDCLCQMEIEGSARAENLTPQQMIELSNLVEKKIAGLEQGDY
jgi:16S rRNA (adenine1518-N6/adenine1519-N6)-dimethyltransferase